MRRFQIKEYVEKRYLANGHTHKSFVLDVQNKLQELGFCKKKGSQSVIRRLMIYEKTATEKIDYDLLKTIAKVLYTSIEKLDNIK